MNKALSVRVLNELRQKLQGVATQKKWQGRKDSNPRMPESKSGALTNLATPLRDSKTNISKSLIVQGNPFI